MVLTGSPCAGLILAQTGIKRHDIDERHVAGIDTLVERCNDLRLDRLEARLQRKPVRKP